MEGHFLFGDRVHSAGILGWETRVDILPVEVRDSAADFLLFTPLSLSSRQVWVWRDILLLISNLPLQLRFLFVTLHPPRLQSQAS